MKERNWRVGEDGECNSVNSKRGWEEIMEKEDRRNVECVSMKREKRKQEL